MKSWAIMLAFFKMANSDHRIGAKHISLYMAILHESIKGRSENLVLVDRRNLMTIAKISSRTTYNKCIRELHIYGFIQYFPSCHPGQSRVSLVELN